MTNNYSYFKCFFFTFSIFMMSSNIGFSQVASNNFLIGVFDPPSLGANFTAVPADYNNDGYADISVKTSGGYWLIDYADPTPNAVNNGFGSWDKVYAEYGGDDAIPVPGDYDGDGKTDLAVKTDSGLWLIDVAWNGLGGWDTNFSNAAIYGGADSHPVPGYYDDDDSLDIAIKRDNGEWFIDRAFNGFGSWDLKFYQYGGADAHPVPGDYNGDGITDLAVKTDDGRWLIDYADPHDSINFGFGGWDPPYITTNWLANAVPAPADYDGDGKVDIAVKEGDKWKIDYAIDDFGNFIQVYNDYGDITAEPVPANYDGCGGADLSVKLKGNGLWLIDKSSNGTGGWDLPNKLGEYTDYHNLLGPTVPYYSADLAKFQKLKNANVDFMVSPDLFYNNYNYARVYAYLWLAKESSLKVFLSGHYIAAKEDPDHHNDYKLDFLNYFKTNLPLGLENAIMGIFLGDEPVPADFNNVKKWTDFFKANDSEKPLYYNLLPRYWSFGNDTNYENYLDQYINNNTTDFISYDHYPIRINEPFYTDFFYNMKTFKDKVGNNRPFWFVVPSHNGIYGDFTFPPYEPKLRFITSSAIAYGSKGLLYWSYMNGIEESSTTYSSVQKMNRYLKDVVGPVVMNADYITTLHKSNTYMNQGRPFASDELVALNNTGVIRDVNNNNILLALYEKAEANSTDYFIWVVNKDLDSPAYSTTLNLDGAFFRSYISPRVDSYASPNSYFVTIPKTYNTSDNTTSINIPELLPGEGVMIKVVRRELVFSGGSLTNKSFVEQESDKSNITESFSIYPNPTKDFINIQTNEEIISITLYSISGQIIKNIETNSKKLDVSNIPSGTYVLKVKTKNGVLTENFSKK